MSLGTVPVPADDFLLEDFLDLDVFAVAAGRTIMPSRWVAELVERAEGAGFAGFF